jgi:hypothetical protein
VRRLPARHPPGRAAGNRSASFSNVSRPSQPPRSHPVSPTHKALPCSRARAARPYGRMSR